MSYLSYAFSSMLLVYPFVRNLNCFGLICSVSVLNVCKSGTPTMSAQICSLYTQTMAQKALPGFGAWAMACQRSCSSSYRPSRWPKVSDNSARVGYVPEPYSPNVHAVEVSTCETYGAVLSCAAAAVQVITRLQTTFTTCNLGHQSYSYWVEKLCLVRVGGRC